MKQVQTNWAGNLTYHASRLHVPSSQEEVQEIVSQSQRVRALGSRHSFNDIADTDGDLISMSNLNQVVELDRSNMTVTVQGGIAYGELCRYLDREGFALHNLASLPHISVAGACATATHGSGIGNGCLSTAVVGLKLIKADGEVVTLDESHPDFFGSVVSLGSLGVVVELKLRVQPAFEVSQRVYERLPLANLLSHFDEIQNSAYSVSLFTHWKDSVVDQVWLKHLGSSEPKADFFGATPAPDHRHPIAGVSPVNCTPQMGEPGPWFERLPHFKLEFTPSNGDELQTEYLIPIKHALEAIEAVNELGEKIGPYLHVSEIRTIAADEFWMSPFYQEPCVGIHFTWKNEWEIVKSLILQIEAVLGSITPRPHWGKLFLMEKVSIQAAFPRFNEFKFLMGRYDPNRKFKNKFVESKIG